MKCVHKETGEPFVGYYWPGFVLGELKNGEIEHYDTNYLNGDIRCGGCGDPMKCHGLIKAPEKATEEPCQILLCPRVYILTDSVGNRGVISKEQFLNYFTCTLEAAPEAVDSLPKLAVV